MEPLLNLLIANLRYTAAALQGPLASELHREFHNSRKLPDKKLTALTGEAENLLDEIGLLIQPPVELLADNFLGMYPRPCVTNYKGHG
jgi:hypothetical protein